jgi:hypothetical protein
VSAPKTPQSQCECFIVPSDHGVLANRTLGEEARHPCSTAIRLSTSHSQAIAPLLALFALSTASRRWHRTWGADDEEACEQLPGDEHVRALDLQTTRAITISAPPHQVWPWLVQMGQGRGGLYTYEWIENALGPQIHNLDRIDPGLQALQIGDRVRLTPEIYLGRVPGQYYRVTEIRPKEALVMLQELPTGAVSSWSFILRPRADKHTRLIVRGRTSAPSGLAARVARQVELLLLEPGYFVMERGMLRGIKQRAEAFPAEAVGGVGPPLTP